MSNQNPPIPHDSYTHNLHEHPLLKAVMTEVLITGLLFELNLSG